MYSRKPKYHNRKITRDGMTFDSIKEADRWTALSYLEKTGKISDLQRQVKFVLIPVQREPDTIGPRGGKRAGKLLEHEVSYIADFTYTQDGMPVVEDTKGLKLDAYIIKRKLMLYIYGVKIKET